jgi:hypothetical protein
MHIQTRVGFDAFLNSTQNFHVHPNNLVLVLRTIFETRLHYYLTQFNTNIMIYYHILINIIFNVMIKDNINSNLNMLTMFKNIIYDIL